MVKEGNSRKEFDWMFGFGICTILFREWMVNGDQLYSRGNTTQYSVRTYMGQNVKYMEQNVKKNGLCICITESLCCVGEIIKT